jgi:hypothetical protein
VLVRPLLDPVGPAARARAGYASPGLKILNGQAACRHQEAAKMSATGPEDIKNVIAE